MEDFKFCPGCQQDRPASQFCQSALRDRRRQRMCKPCEAARFDRRNDESRSLATSHREPWSDAEESTLLERRAAGDSITMVAHALGRTYAAICARLRDIARRGVVDRG